MTITYGLTATGFLPKPLTQIRADMNTALQAAFGSSIDLSDRSILGQIVGILAEREALVWQLAQQLYYSMDPTAATGPALDALAALTGTTRLPATFSTVTGTFTGTPTTNIASGTQAKTASTAVVFATTAAATITLLASWAQSTSYSVGARVTANGSAYQCTVAGTSNGSGTGPSATSNPVPADGGVTWLFLGTPGTASGTGAVDVAMQATVAGPLVASAGDLTVPVTPVGGWQGITNVSAATLGTNSQTDAQLRQSRVTQLAGDGSSTAPAIQALILALATTPVVTSCTVFANNGDTTDSGGRPPHSIECLIQGGANQDIWNALLADVAAGVNTFGNTTGTAVDSQGTSHTLSFSRPVSITVYVDVTLTYNAATYGGDAAIKNAIVAYAASAPIDLDVFASQIASVALSVAGVLDVNPVRIYTDVIGTPTAWAPTTGYVSTPGSRSVVTNDGGRTYICVAGGTSAGSGGPTGTGTVIVDGGVTWYFLGNTINITDHQLMSIAVGNVNVHSSAATQI